MDGAVTRTIPTTIEEYIVWCDEKIEDLEKQLVEAQKKVDRLQAECEVRNFAIRRLRLASGDPNSEQHTPNITDTDIANNVANRLRIVSERKKKRQESKLKRLRETFGKEYNALCSAYGIAYPPVFIIEPFATVETPFVQRFEAPRQSQLAHAQATTESLRPVSAEVVAKLGCYNSGERVYGLYWFDRNWAFRNKVLPPKRSVRTGLYGTRTPHRPNPVGMASATVVDPVDTGKLELGLAGMDTLLGTPMLYLRRAEEDEITKAATARCGWMEEKLLPLYYDEGEALYTLTNAQQFKEELAFLETAYPTINTTQMIESQLTRTPFRCRRRAEKTTETTRVFGVGIFRVVYTVNPENHTVQIDSIRPGASYSSLVDLRKIDDDAEKVCTFVERFGVDKK